MGIEAAYRHRLEEPSDEFRYLIEYGASIGEHLYLRTKLDVIKSIENGEPISQGIGNPTLNPEFDLGRMEFTAGWSLTPKSVKGNRWGIETTYTRDLFGDDTLQGNTIQVGLTFIH